MAKYYEMEALPEFWVMDHNTLKKEYNGIGPEWFPEKIRDKVTEYFAFQEESCLIHDCENNIRPKTQKQFKLWNDRLYSNMIKKIKSEKNAGKVYFWRFWRKESVLRLKLRARFLYRMCRRYGKSAFFNKEVK
jgi:hypothetical protein